MDRWVYACNFLFVAFCCYSIVLVQVSGIIRSLTIIYFLLLSVTKLNTIDSIVSMLIPVVSDIFMSPRYLTVVNLPSPARLCRCFTIVVSDIFMSLTINHGFSIKA